MNPSIPEYGAALRDTDDVRPSARVEAGERAVFVGSGDSLASAMLAEHYGHRASSSGDIAWIDRFPAHVDTVVGISHSGTSGATIMALRAARAAGARTIAITSAPQSPLADAADDVQLVPTLRIEERTPSAGHVMLGLGVLAMNGVPVAAATSAIAERLDAWEGLAESVADELPASAPASVSVLTLPDRRSAGEFFALKMIEATGVATRAVPLEESGHVDYFVGPQQSLVLEVIGAAGLARFDRLHRALCATGQTVRRIRTERRDDDCSDAAERLDDLATAVVVTLVADAAAARWGRTPFRGGAVNMDAAHIKLAELEQDPAMQRLVP